MFQKLVYCGHIHKQLFFSDPYVRIDLVACNGDVIDSVLTKTKKRVC